MIAAALLGCPGPKSGTATIGPAGGTVRLSSGPSLEIPKGALAANTTITITAADVTAPNGAISKVFQFGPEGTSFALPVTVSFPLPAGTNDGLIYWTQAGSTTDFGILPTTISAGRASGRILHLSLGFFGKHEPECYPGALLDCENKTMAEWGSREDRCNKMQDSGDRLACLLGVFVGSSIAIGECERKGGCNGTPGAYAAVTLA
jgi:hypothetical protein